MMIPEVYYGPIYEIEHEDGSCDFVPPDGLIKAKPTDKTTKLKKNYLVRWNSPGYLDCSEWNYYPCAVSEKHAIELFCHDQDVCPTCYEQCYYEDDPCQPEESTT